VFENFFPLGTQENNVLSRVPRTWELLFPKFLHDVPEKLAVVEIFSGDLKI